MCVEIGALMANFSCPFSGLASPVRGSARPCVVSGHQKYIHMKFSVLTTMVEFRMQFESKPTVWICPLEASLIKQSDCCDFPLYTLSVRKTVQATKVTHFVKTVSEQLCHWNYCIIAWLPSVQLILHAEGVKEDTKFG